DGDVDLLVLRVAWQTDDLHPVKQRPGDVHRVGGAEEHHIRQVVIDFQIVIVEVVVLLGVEHFEQRRGRVATHVLPHLVDFIEQEQRVAHTDLGHLLYQTPGHGAYVGAAVTADLRLVSHPAKRHAHKLAVGRGGDGFRSEERRVGNGCRSRWTRWR